MYTRLHWAKHPREREEVRHIHTHVREEVRHVHPHVREDVKHKHPHVSEDAKHKHSQVSEDAKHKLGQSDLQQTFFLPHAHNLGTNRTIYDRSIFILIHLIPTYEHSVGTFNF